MTEEMSVKKRLNAFCELESEWRDHPDLAEPNGLKSKLSPQKGSEIGVLGIVEFKDEPQFYKGGID